MIGPTLSNQTTYKFRDKMIRKQELIMNDMLVKRKELLMIAGVVSRKEVKVEEMVMDGDVEDKANATHAWVEVRECEGLMG